MSPLSGILSHSFIIGEGSTLKENNFNSITLWQSQLQCNTCVRHNSMAVGCELYIHFTFVIYACMAEAFKES